MQDRRRKLESADEWHSIRGVTMWRVLILAVISLPAIAQAPADERGVADSILSSQQRLAFLRRAVDSAQERLSGAELEARQAAEQEQAARKRREASTKALEQARKQFSEARAAYETESAAFDRLRRADSPKTKPQPGKGTP